MTAILAFDTASSQVSVALSDGEGTLAEAVSTQGMRHGEELVPLIQRVLGEAGRDRHDLTAVAVGVGPGPFTGLRVGLVTARTLGYVLDLPVYGVCTLDILAYEWASTGALAALAGFAVATDARRKEVYLATYDDLGRRLGGPVVDHPAALATDAPTVGEGARLYPEAFPRPVGPAHPSAAWLARAVAAEAVELHDPEPLYLRRPDAEGAYR